MEKNISNKKLKDQVTDFLESNSKGAVATKIILATIALGGVVFVGAAAPGIIKAVDAVRRMNEEGEREVSMKKSTVQSTFSQFKRNGYIKLRKSKSGKITVILTEKGKRHVFDFTQRMVIKEPIIWDRKWRIVIFDIPVAKRMEREMFRRKIKEMGFQQLQKSVWVYPYKCEDEVLFLAKQFKIVKYVEILTVQKLIHIQDLRKRFNL